MKAQPEFRAGLSPLHGLTRPGCGGGGAGDFAWGRCWVSQRAVAGAPARWRGRFRNDIVFLTSSVPPTPQIGGVESAARGDHRSGHSAPCHLRRDGTRVKALWFFWGGILSQAREWMAPRPAAGQARNLGEGIRLFMRHCTEYAFVPAIRPAGVELKFRNDGGGGVIFGYNSLSNAASSSARPRRF